MGKYTLMIEDTPLVRFSMSPGFKSEVELLVDSPRLLPMALIPALWGYGSRQVKQPHADSVLVDWVRERIYPKHRANNKMVLQAMGLYSPNERIIHTSYGVSATDSYWVDWEGSNATWKKVNPRKNVLNKGLSYTAFTGEVRKAGVEVSSEWSLGGSFPKAWRRGKDGKLYLWKAGRTGAANWGYEPYVEWQASEVLRYLGLNSVQYELRKWQGRVATVSQNEASESVFWEPFFDGIRFGNGGYPGTYEQLVALVETRGKAKGIAKEFFDTLFIDCIILNTDRHLGNLSFRRSVKTGEVLGLTPMYDFNLSLLADGMKGDPYPSSLDSHQLRGVPFVNQGAGLLNEERAGWCKRLFNYEVKQHRNYTVPGWRVKYSTKIVQRQSRGILTAKRYPVRGISGVPTPVFRLLV